MPHQLNMFDSYTKSLDELDDMILSCKACHYHLISDDRVPGKGSIDSKLMIVGQGPGPREIEAGEPYVGSSGRLLKRIMRKVDIPLNNVYLTNLIRCMPPKGKNITTKAIRMCSRWLDDEVGLITPKLIVCLGGMAEKQLMNRGPISEVSGKIFGTTYGIPGISTYHTAYLLRVRSNDRDKYLELSRIVYEHWKLIADYIKE